MNYVYEAGDKPTRGRQAQAWFRRGSPDYVGDLPNVERAVASHSYHTTWPRDTLRAVRARLRDSLAAVDPALAFWQTEYCVLETTPHIRGRGRDSTIDAALYIAGVIHADLTVANASAWHWWLAITPYDYKDGLLYMDRDSLAGAVRDTKMLWALGHWSRFVRPGMRRVDAEVSGADDVDAEDAELLVSAYREPASGRLVTVLVNRGGAREVTLRGVGARAARVYRTTSAPDVNLRFSGLLRPGQPLAMPARSFATVVSP
jgi:hypothetical protein